MADYNHGLDNDRQIRGASFRLGHGVTTLGALLPCAHNDAITYRATMETTGLAAVTVALQTGLRAGALCSGLRRLGHQPGRFPGQRILLDILEGSGDIYSSLCIPSPRCFDWWVAALELRVALPSSCQTCGPTRSHGHQHDASLNR